MNKKIITLILVVGAFACGVLLDHTVLMHENEIIIGSEDLGGYDDTFGSTVAIYVEQTTGEGNYVQKNNVPNDGSVYIVNSATHCIGGGI